MRQHRIYHTRGTRIYCETWFQVSEEEFDSDPDLFAALDRFPVKLMAQVHYEKPKSALPVSRFHVQAHPNIPADLVLDEARYFLTTLKTMYQL